jgi:hypothetical protein
MEPEENRLRRGKPQPLTRAIEYVGLIVDLIGGGIIRSWPLTHLRASTEPRREGHRGWRNATPRALLSSTGTPPPSAREIRAGGVAGVQALLTRPAVSARLGFHRRIAKPADSP